MSRQPKYACGVKVFHPPSRVSHCRILTPSQHGTFWNATPINRRVQRFSTRGIVAIEQRESSYTVVCHRSRAIRGPDPTDRSARPRVRPDAQIGANRAGECAGSRGPGGGVAPRWCIRRAVATCLSHLECRSDTAEYGRTSGTFRRTAARSLVALIPRQPNSEASGRRRAGNLPDLPEAAPSSTSVTSCGRMPPASWSRSSAQPVRTNPSGHEQRPPLVTSNIEISEANLIFVP
jgi:hypothetical protein